MKCPECHGTGRVPIKGAVNRTIREYHAWIYWYDPTCPECHGSGILSCCDPQNDPLAPKENPEKVVTNE